MFVMCEFKPHRPATECQTHLHGLLLSWCSIQERLRGAAGGANAWGVPVSVPPPRFVQCDPVLAGVLVPVTVSSIIASCCVGLFPAICPPDQLPGTLRATAGCWSP